MSSKPELTTTLLSRQESIGLSSMARSQRRSGTTAGDSSLSTAERRQRVQAFHDALKGDSTGILTLPEYISPDLSPDQTLSLILQDACSTANSLVDFFPDDSEDDDNEEGQ